MNNPWVKIAPPSKDLSARRVDHEHPLNLFWARDHMGKYLLIYEFSEEVGVKVENYPTLLEYLLILSSQGIPAECRN